MTDTRFELQSTYTLDPRAFDRHRQIWPRMALKGQKSRSYFLTWNMWRMDTVTMLDMAEITECPWASLWMTLRGYGDRHVAIYVSPHDWHSLLVFFFFSLFFFGGRFVCLVGRFMCSFSCEILKMFGSGKQISWCPRLHSGSSTVTAVMCSDYSRHIAGGIPPRKF